MNLDDTIVAIATPPGRGGIGIVRLAGPQAKSIAEPMLRLKLNKALEPNRAQRCDLLENQPAKNATRIDEVVVTYFQKPHSYTTDDIVEIAAHGSPVVLSHIVEQALSQGARLAEPGEFTMRAFLNGRLDLTQAEAVRDLIDAQTLFQAKVAAQQLEGALSNRLKPIKQKLVDLIALLEAGIDFAEDDISVAQDATIQARIAEVKSPLQQLAATFTYGKIVHQGLTLAIVGRPNVGKSSLFNRLVERERAIVTAQPGTTRDLISETVAIGGIPVNLVDTAGIRKSEDEAESLGIKKSREALAEADLVLVVIDATRTEEKEDEELQAQLKDRPVIVVENKSDLLPPLPPPVILSGANASQSEALAQSKACPELAEGNPYPITATSPHPIHIQTSALTGEGIPALREAILTQIAGDQSRSQEPGFLTSIRHQKLVKESEVALQAATAAVTAKVPHEMLLMDLYAALRPLDEITGITTTEDILALIFSTFCIGK